jgi:signal transduction histidine kinase
MKLSAWRDDLDIADARRCPNLAAFLEGYARFARLPDPRPQDVDWASLLAGVRALYPFELDGEIPQGHAHLDPAQIQQVLINLLKNACEASEGEPSVSVRIARTADGGTALQVADRGRGMDEAEMRQALLPFYSTKPSGTGLGLPLCREIVEAHGGKIRLESRTDGGTVVTCLFPARPLAVPAAVVRDVRE